MARKNKRPVIEHYKYRLLILLRQLSHEDYEVAKEWLPWRLSIHKDTFRNWIYTPAGSHREIPGHAILLMAGFFGVDPMDLYTAPPDMAKMADDFQQFKNAN